MAAPFTVQLPAVGAKPWNLNPAINELRTRIGTTDDVINTGRLSPAGISETVKTSPQDATSQVLYDQINLVSNKKWTP